MTVLGGTSKRQADIPVRHGKVVIQVALGFVALASSDQGFINYLFIGVEDYEESEKFLAVLMTDI